MRLTKTLKSAIYAHAQACYPAESCGLIIDGVYHACTNIAPQDSFEIDPHEYIKLSEQGQIDAIVHSHPDGSAEPSEIDRVQMGLHGIDWVICGFGVHGDGEPYCDIKRHKPKAYQAPLLGRDYHHGVQDCYSLVRDYYARELDIALPDFARVVDWWEDPNHAPLYEQNFAKAGFRRLEHGEPIQSHDVILCRVGRTHHVNHALIYLGDGTLNSETTPAVMGDSLVLHHPHGALSRREIYGESWRKRTAMVLRHGGFVG